MKATLTILLALTGVCAFHPSASVLPKLQNGRAKTTMLAAAAAADEGQAGLPGSTANLVKSIVGSGVLSLPVGLAAFSSSRAALLPALVLLSVAGSVSGYCFSMVARVCAATGSTSWGEAWSKSVGEKVKASITIHQLSPKASIIIHQLSPSIACSHLLLTCCSRNHSTNSIRHWSYCRATAGVTAVA